MPLGSVSPFRPTGTVSVQAGVTSATVTLPAGGDSVVVTNAANSLVFVRFGADSGVVATSADMPIVSGGKVILSINGLIGFAAAVAPSGNGTVYFSRGDGSVV